MALVVYVRAESYTVCRIQRRQPPNLLLDARVVIDKKQAVLDSIGYPAAGKIIKIHAVLRLIPLLPDFQMAAPVCQKISVGFRFLQRAAVKEKTAVDVKEKPDSARLKCLHGISPVVE